MALLSEFACTQIKTQVLPFLKKKKIQSVSVHMKKRFRTENMACKEERGKCVILNGETSCLDQIETRWERKNQRSKAETHSGKRHQRQNVLTSQRNGTSQTSLPVVLDHMACRDRPSAETWEANRSRHPESAKELIQEAVRSRPTWLGASIREVQDVACSQRGQREDEEVSVCPCPAPVLGSQGESGLLSWCL